MPSPATTGGSTWLPMISGHSLRQFRWQLTRAQQVVSLLRRSRFILRPLAASVNRSNPEIFIENYLNGLDDFHLILEPPRREFLNFRLCRLAGQKQ